VYLDLIRQFGIPSALHHDKEKFGMSQRIKKIHGDLVNDDQ
jgi:hypothetical protein